MRHISLLFLLISGLAFQSCSQSTSVQHDEHDHDHEDIAQIASQSSDFEKLELSEAEWKEKLSAEEFRILRKKGTERAFTGKYWNNKKAGTYICSGCQLPLFTSDTKFKSGTGWPSFYEPIQSEFILEETDVSYGMSRTEVLCGRCDGHLGHVFPDGPKPTGLRYCINGNAMTFVPEEGTKKE